MAAPPEPFIVALLLGITLAAFLVAIFQKDYVRAVIAFAAGSALLAALFAYPGAPLAAGLELTRAPGPPRAGDGLDRPGPLGGPGPRSRGPGLHRPRGGLRRAPRPRPPGGGGMTDPAVAILGAGSAALFAGGVLALVGGRGPVEGLPGVGGAGEGGSPP